MCGIFGILPTGNLNPNILNLFAKKSQRRGSDASGVYFFSNGDYKLLRSTEKLTHVAKSVRYQDIEFIMGHSRLVTNSVADNQPVNRNKIVVIHNGIIVNDKSIWPLINQEQSLGVDTEVLAGIVESALFDGVEISDIPQKIFELCEGAVSAAIAIPELGKLLLLSNTGDLNIGNSSEGVAFASEESTLRESGYREIRQLKNDFEIFDIPISIKIEERTSNTKKGALNLLPTLGSDRREESLLQFRNVDLVRCALCILPETMPFIVFDENGVCNYCLNYRKKSNTQDPNKLREILTEYKKTNGPKVIIPFSGGRDSSFTLHIAAQELELQPITFTYDWGMVTDLARRNISRMTSSLGVENIVIAADIRKKRQYIHNNLKAWLKSPNLGMLSILTAGDKHFFKYVDVVRRETGVNLQIWGINPLETTHFKSGFLGIRPNFMAKTVYAQGIRSQMQYQTKRLAAMKKSPGYFNSSLWDTLSGEYYRSVRPRIDYFELFDYYNWNESEIDQTLFSYNWETANDTKSTWRVGDGTAAFYNYVYHTVAGLSEHDTFRSNQIREGQLTRDDALRLANDENLPRYKNIKWYLDAIGVDFEDTLRIVNSIPKLHGPISGLL